MGINISVDINPDYVCVRSSGRFSPQSYEQTVRTVVDAVLIYDKPRVLIDATEVVGAIPDSDYLRGPAYLVAEAQLHVPGRIQKLAFVCDPRQFDPAGRGQSVANGGGVPTRVFTDLAEAVEWLTG